jgi:hypothetical protein
MYFVMGFAELQLAEWFCNGQPLGEASLGVPEYGPPMTNARSTRWRSPTSTRR